MKPFLMKFARTGDEFSSAMTRQTRYDTDHEILIYQDTDRFERVIDDLSCLRGTGSVVTFAHTDPTRDEETDR